MGTLFKAPKVETPKPPPPPPTIDDATRTEEFSAKLARRRGRMATMRGGSSGSPSVAVKTLLG